MMRVYVVFYCSCFFRLGSKSSTYLFLHLLWLHTDKNYISTIYEYLYKSDGGLERGKIPTK